MKKLLILAIMMLRICSVSVLAQQDVMFTQYMHNEVTINPAYAGSHQVGSITALYRNQWMNMKGAPVSYSFNAHTPTAIQGDKVGLGISLLNDRVGVTDNLHFFGIYSYRISINEKSSLQLGLQAGFNNFKSGLSMLSPKNFGDANFTHGSISSFNLNFGTGAYYFADHFYLGVSVPRLINNKAKYMEEVLSKQARHLFITSGYIFDVSPDIKVKPSLMYKFTKGAPMELDITGNVIFRDVLWTGLSWRSFDSIDILLGIQATKQIHIGYAYDYTTTELNKFNTGSHEVLLNYRLNFSTTRILTPRYY